jgi:hypothetical protein
MKENEYGIWVRFYDRLHVGGGGQDERDVIVSKTSMKLDCAKMN